MFRQFFGQYLLNSGHIGSEQLRDALELMQSTHVKLGVLAVNEGYMTGTQVEEVHEKQKQVDKRFGEIAVEMGYLTEEQVEGMLSAQKQNHLLLAQALVDNGYMTIDEFSVALITYKTENGLSDEKFEAIKNGDIDLLVENLVPIEEPERKAAFVQYLSLFAKNIIRFIDANARLEAKPAAGQLKGQWYVEQEITGVVPLYTAISADEKVFLKIASIYAEEELNQVDELACASVGEFLNLHNGIFLVNMSNKGIELGMDPQQVNPNAVIELTGPAYLITIHIQDGSFQLVLSDNPETVSVHPNSASSSLA
ncbi:hypothetical protein CVD28_11420 [Bacillus sp. M6-12]|uniref:hypothetical protein n=1 Tax=Bacillus sp. M6-12 TaxID=2054166 RepID=UPI000C78F75D|nr:hypothetical protein [Bacillus sp. M6-12]PLS17596.1 hypothetical protein CVD28_11420 [Bacillus sp. M6-12]